MEWLKSLVALIFAETVEDIQAQATKRITRAIDAHTKRSEKAFEKVKKLEAEKQAADDQVKRGENYKKNLEKMFDE